MTSWSKVTPRSWTTEEKVKWKEADKEERATESRLASCWRVSTVKPNIVLYFTINKNRFLQKRPQCEEPQRARSGFEVKDEESLPETMVEQTGGESLFHR